MSEQDTRRDEEIRALKLSLALEEYEIASRLAEELGIDISEHLPEEAV